MGVRRIAETLLGLAVLILCAMVGGGVEAAANSGQGSLLAARELPPFLQATLHARQLTQSAESSVLANPQPVGTLVPISDVVVTATDNRQLRFGLATYSSAGDAAYPAISTDTGITWKIDGPLFHVDALQGASVITSVGSFGTDGAYYWGRGGNVVWVTTDRGSHWWLTGFSYGVNRVTASHGTLRADALGRQLKGGEIESFRYTSNDSGRTWELRGRLANLRSTSRRGWRAPSTQSRRSGARSTATLENRIRLAARTCPSSVLQGGYSPDHGIHNTSRADPLGEALAKRYLQNRVASSAHGGARMRVRATGVGSWRVGGLGSPDLSCVRGQ